MIKLSFIGREVPFELIKFPAGETHIRVSKPFDQISVFFESNDDMINTLLLLDKNPDAKIYMPYFPYGRQDREIIKSDVFSLRAIANMFEDVNITIIDPHSKETNCLLRYSTVTVIDQHEVFDYSLYKDIPNLVLLAPDEGSITKTKRLAEILNIKYYSATKIRDKETGKFIKFNVPEIEEENILIVDDICDGGGTFLGIANKLPNKNLHLWTTHGIYSKGINILLEKFETVACYNHVSTGEFKFYTKGVIYV